MGPLKGVRVLDLTRLLPGPLCTHHLARLGAAVIKVESPPTAAGQGGNVDYVRGIPPFVKPVSEDGSANRHGILFETLNCGKQGLSVDLKSPRGLEVLRKLVPTVDVVVESNRPGVMDKLGFGYEDLKKLNPGIVYCSLSGYGATGPYNHRAGHDMNYMATAGALAVSGEEGSTPSTIGFQAADVTGTLNGVIGILAALYERRVTGKGQHVDVSMTEAALGLALPSLVYGLLDPDQSKSIKPPKRGHGILDGGLPNYRVYSTKDNKYLSVGSLESHFWERICRAVGKQPEEVDTIEKAEALFLTKTQKEWMDLLDPLDACVEPILEPVDVFKHPQHVARKVTFPVDQSKNAPAQIVLGPRMGNHEAQRLAPAPGIGQHTEQLLIDAGYSKSEVAELVAQGAVFASKK